MIPSDMGVGGGIAAKNQGSIFTKGILEKGKTLLDNDLHDSNIGVCAKTKQHYPGKYLTDQVVNTTDPHCGLRGNRFQFPGVEQQIR